METQEFIIVVTAIALIVLVMLVIVKQNLLKNIEKPNKGYFIYFVLANDDGTWETITLRTYATNYHKKLLSGSHGKVLRLNLYQDDTFYKSYKPEEYDDLMLFVKQNRWV
jgi:hypothetical protein